MGDGAQSAPARYEGRKRGSSMRLVIVADSFGVLVDAEESVEVLREWVAPDGRYVWTEGRRRVSREFKFAGGSGTMAKCRV